MSSDGTYDAHETGRMRQMHDRIAETIVVLDTKRGNAKDPRP